MKKIILLCLILLLSGCYEESGKLVTTYTKKENINSLYKEITYNIDFKSDIVNEVEVIYYYNDTDLNTISSVKSSINTTDRFINDLRKNIILNNDNEFKVSYNINLSDSKEILDKFLVEERRSNIVKNLKEKGFECN